MSGALDTLERSARSFLDAADAFLANLAAISWGALAAALLLHGGYVTIRTRAWLHTLRAAYPAEQVRWREVWASYVTGLGVNSILPARAGEVARLYLARQSIPGSSYPAVGSSFLVEVIFDVAAGLTVISFALTQGVFPDLPDLPRLPAFELSILARHPWVIAVIAAVAAGAVTVISVRVRAFWGKVRQGLAILRQPRRYVRQVLAIQLVAYALRFASFWLMLEAFGIGGSVRDVLLVMAAFSLSTLVPFTPGGLGAQQALLAVIFAGAASAGQVAAFSVGQQLSLIAFNVLVAFAALMLVFGTRDWRAILRAGRAERADESA